MTEDPLLGQFLDFLAHDIASHPERLQSVGTGLAQRIQSLVGGVESISTLRCRQTMNERSQAVPLSRQWLDNLRPPLVPGSA